MTTKRAHSPEVATVEGKDGIGVMVGGEGYVHRTRQELPVRRPASRMDGGRASS